MSSIAGLISGFGRHLLAQPLWLQAWIGWMIAASTTSLAFLDVVRYGLGARSVVG